jgi:hypothetical protein
MSQTEGMRLRPLWAKLAKEIGTRTFPERIKEVLLQNHEDEIDLAIGTDDPENLEPLVRVASSLYTIQLKAGGSRRRRKKEPTGEGIQNRTVTPEVGQYERLRAEALSEYLAKLITIHPEVARFRQRVLGGELLNPEQARTLLSLPTTELDDLRKLSEVLTKSHPWNIDDAMWFVLTGIHPVVQPIQAKINSSWTIGTRAHTTISLTVQPWVPPETVGAAYRQLQKKVIGGECGRIGDKNLKLLQFVANRADANGKLPKGDMLVQEWDRRWKREHPEWCYGSDKRRFWRDFRNVQRNMTNSKRAGPFLEADAPSPEEYMPQI